MDYIENGISSITRFCRVR